MIICVEFPVWNKAMPKIYVDISPQENALFSSSIHITRDTASMSHLQAKQMNRLNFSGIWKIILI